MKTEGSVAQDKKSYCVLGNKRPDLDIKDINRGCGNRKKMKGILDSIPFTSVSQGKGMTYFSPLSVKDAR